MVCRNTRKDDEVWRFFLHSDLLKAVLDADPMFEPILSSVESPKGSRIISINRDLVGQAMSDELEPRKTAPGQAWKFGAEIAPS